MMTKREAQKLVKQIKTDDPIWTAAKVTTFVQYDPSDGSHINDVVSYRVTIRDHRLCYGSPWEEEFSAAWQWAERLEALQAYEAKQVA